MERKTVRAKDDLPDAKVSLLLVDEIDEEDVVLVLTKNELKDLIDGYEVGTRNRIRSRHRYYKNKPDAGRYAIRDYPLEFRVYRDSNTGWLNDVGTN